eukprot:CAMPEP_0172673248 /NCGR_PEP_ID=MMETSP1074-20121228/12032_1 /TAXON_ID=2916 /ORGANISM="Ceratium fusus, Strain PA161109" /LENGTH=263 /DNA_ID=CAMNT_0013490523 /DNA_START=290 /DNA_END=1081 /DNA_ORIENTATION=+
MSGSHHAPAPAPLNLPPSGQDLASGGASSVDLHAKAAEAGGARSKSNNGSKSSSGIQFAAKRALAVQRGTTSPRKAAEAGAARSKSNNGSNSSSAIQFAAKRALAVQRGTTAQPNGHGRASNVLGPLCARDRKGERTGCKSNCRCGVSERCYPKFRTASAEHIDIGVCSPAVVVLVFMSMAIIGNFLACVVVLRVFFQWRERIRAMMESGYYNLEDAPPLDPRLLAPPHHMVISHLHAAPDYEAAPGSQRPRKDLSPLRCQGP